jgi:NAD(P)-dependent dehydrogenase (short-subunit alcohol dehydrogenase family)
MNRIDLDGRVAVVTGAAVGIGFATAARLSASGASVSVWDRDAAKLAEAGKALTDAGRTTTVVVDVADAKSVEAATRQTVEQFGRIDILVNSAGVAGTNYTVWETPVEEWRRVVDIDLTGTFLCCRAVVPGMIANGYGRIVNIASIAGKEGNPNAGHYSAAKAGVIGLTKSLGKECAETGVIANCIAPAVIETPILSQSTREQIDYMVAKIPMGRVGQPDEVAALIAWLVSEECSFSTGAVYDISGGRATY